VNTFWVWLIRPLLDRRFWYREFYLRSRHWRAIRREKLEKAGYRCERCRLPLFVKEERLVMDVHHLTYERLFHERLDDLQVLCRHCHNEVHK
jgi:5-methylcytosine-specific restriction endonuclease McrA